MATKRYIKNVIKSFTQVVPDAIGESLPGAKGLFNLIKNPAGEGSTVKETFKEIVGDYKTEVDTVTGIFKKFKKGVKTGAFYDRDNDIDMSALVGDLNLDLDKDEDLFGDSDWESSGSTTASKDVGGGTANVNFVNTDDGSSAELISGAMAIGSARTVGAIEKGTAINFAVMNSIDSRLSRMEEANQRFFASNLELLSSIKSNIEAMAKIQGMKETDLPASQMDRLFGDGSQEFNLRLYMRHLSRKAKNNEFVGMIPMMGMMNPMNMATMMGTQYLLKKIPIFNTIEKMSKMLEGIGQITLSNMANVKGNGVISKLFRFFGVKSTAEVGKVNLGKMAKGPLPFDGETKEAITRAIPGYLAKILNVMKNGRGAKDDTLELYDTDSRQFKTAGSVSRKRKDSEQYDMGEIRNFIELCVAASGATGDDEVKVREEIFKVVRERALSGKSFADKDLFSSLSGKMKTIIQGVHHKILQDSNKVNALETSRFAYISTKQTESYSDVEKFAEHFKTNDQDRKETLYLNDYFEKKNRPKIEKLLKDLFGEDDAVKVLRAYKDEYPKKKRANVFYSLDDFIKEQLDETKLKRLKDTIEQANDSLNGKTFESSLESRLNDIDIANIDISRIDNFVNLDDIKNPKARRAVEKGLNWRINGIQNIAEKGDAFFKKAGEKFSKSLGFAEGGYTGPGGKYEKAGTVHKGEYVVPANIVKDPRGAKFVDKLEQMRTQLQNMTGQVNSNASDLASDLINGEDLSGRQINKRFKLYQELINLNVPYDDAISVARLIQTDPKTAKAFLTYAKKNKKKADMEAWKKRDVDGTLGEIVKNDIVSPIKEAVLGAKAAVKDGNLTAGDILGKAKDMFPDMAKYAGAGLAAGFFLPGGPLLGAITGGAIGALKQNEALRGYFFGARDQNGEVQRRGLFPKLAGTFIKTIYGKETGEAAEKNMRSFFQNPLQTLARAWKDPEGRKIMLTSGAGGLLGSMFGPGGAILGAFAGGMLGKRKQQSYFSKVLFGDRIIGKDGAVKGYKGGLWQSLSGTFNALVAGPAQAMLVGGSLTDYKDMLTGKISPHKIRANLKKGLMNVAGGAAAGGLLGSFFGPGGTLVGALLGGTTGLRPVRAFAKRIMFGKDDPTKKKGGLFGVVTKIGSLATTFASFLAHGINPVDHPFLSKIGKVLGTLIGIPFHIAGGTAKGVGKALSFFRRYSTSSHTVLRGKDLIAALNSDDKASTADKAIGSGVGIIVDTLTEIKDHMTGNSTEAKASVYEANNGTNTAEEIANKQQEAAAEKEKAEDKKQKSFFGKMMTKIHGTLEDGNNSTKGLLGTIASGITSIIPLIGGSSVLNSLGNFGKVGKGFLKGAAMAGVITGGIGVAKGIYNSYKADHPEDRIDANDQAIDGARLGEQSSVLLKMTDKFKKLKDGTSGLVSKAWGGIKTKAGKLTEGAKALAGKIKDKASALMELFSSAKKCIPRFLRSLTKSASNILKKAPLLGGFFVAIEEIIAIKKFVESKNVSSISPRQRIISLVKDSAAAFASLIMLIIDGALLATGVGAILVGLITVIDIALTFFSGDSIADKVGRFIADNLGGLIADSFGWTVEKEHAWKTGQLEAYEKRHSHTADEPDAKVIAKQVIGGAENSTVPRQGSVSQYYNFDAYNSAKSNASHSNGSEPRGIKINGATVKDYNTESSSSKDIMDPYTSLAPRENFDPNTYDINKPVNNPFEYLVITGNKGQESFNKLEPGTKRDLAHIAKIYYMKYGEKLPISSGYRDPNNQGILWSDINGDAKAIAKMALGKNPGMTLKTNFPGTSDHELGNAIDIDNSGGIDKKNERMIRMFGYAADDPAMLDPSGEKAPYRIKPDSVLGIYNALKKKNREKPLSRASGSQKSWRDGKKDYNEHWHFQSIANRTLDAKRWKESYPARVKALDKLDDYIKSESGGRQRLADSVKAEYGNPEFAHHMGQIHRTQKDSRGNLSITTKNDVGDDVETSSKSKQQILEDPKRDIIIGLLARILEAIKNNAGTASNAITKAMNDLIIPESEALTPNSSVMTLLGSRLCVGL